MEFLKFQCHWVVWTSGGLSEINTSLLSSLIFKVCSFLDRRGLITLMVGFKEVYMVAVTV